MRYTLRLFGRLPLLTLDCEQYEHEAAEEDTGIAGGATHNFSLATNTEVSEVEGEPWDCRFGFRP